MTSGQYEDQLTSENWQLPVSCQLGLHYILQNGSLHDLHVVVEVLRLKDQLQLTLNVHSFYLIHGTGSAGWGTNIIANTTVNFSPGSNVGQ